MQKVYLTFDMEPIVSRVSFNPTIYNNVLLGSLYIARELQKRNLKGTFYLSLSHKTPALDRSTYLDNLELLLDALRAFPNIRVQPHLHCYGLPMSFETNIDRFEAYDREQQTAMLGWARNFLEERGFAVDSFRPGSYSRNAHYYAALQDAGYRYSSTLDKAKPHIKLQTGEQLTAAPYKTESGVVEYPVTSLLIRNIRRKEEVVNLSPDFFTLESMERYLASQPYLNINFHSFSVFANRLTRENHPGQWRNNLRYFLVEKPLNLLLRRLHQETIHHATPFRRELLKWLDHFDRKDVTTCFIGEDAEPLPEDFREPQHSEWAGGPN